MTDASKQAIDAGKKVSRMRYLTIAAAAAGASFALIAVAATQLDTRLVAADQVMLSKPSVSFESAVGADADSYVE